MINAMHAFARSSLLALALFVVSATAWGKPAPAPAEYKAADTNFYLRSSVLKTEPNALIFTAAELQQKGDSYFVHLHKPPPSIYVEIKRDWLEPVTPPSMPDSLGIAPDVMQLRELQGDVQIELPASPLSFVPGTEEMPIPNGTVIKTGANGTVAILFGGVDSARLTPNSEAVVEQTLTPKLRSTMVEIKSGAVFSKVGLRPNEKQNYQVHTPYGVAAARGTDFVAVVLPDRTDVWVAQGTVRFDQPNGETVGTVKSAGTGTLQIVRYPVITDPRAAMMATAQTMTMAMNFIPTVNLKIKALQDQVAQGLKMTPRERLYLSLMKHVPCLIKLALVQPAATLSPPAEKPASAKAVAPPIPTPSASAPLNPATTSPNPSAPIAPPTGFELHHSMGP
jgi:hypothetical protein